MSADVQIPLSHDLYYFSCWWGVRQSMCISPGWTMWQRNEPSLWQGERVLRDSGMFRNKSTHHRQWEISAMNCRCLIRVSWLLRNLSSDTNVNEDVNRNIQCFCWPWGRGLWGWRDNGGTHSDGRGKDKKKIRLQRPLRRPNTFLLCHRLKSICLLSCDPAVLHIHLCSGVGRGKVNIGCRCDIHIVYGHVLFLFVGGYNVIIVIDGVFYFVPQKGRRF